MKHYTNYTKTALFFIIPQVLITLIFFIWPAGSALFQSFFYSDAFGLHRWFAGFGNFSDLWHNSDYGMAVGVTAIIAVSVTLLTMSFGLAVAHLVNVRQKGQQLYKTLLLWPYAVAPAVAAILWRFLCHPTLGWFAHALARFGIDFNYTIHAKQALMVVIMTASWQQFSYNFLFFLVALKRITSYLIDAAIIDGASAWRKLFFHYCLRRLFFWW